MENDVAGFGMRQTVWCKKDDCFCLSTGRLLDQINRTDQTNVFILQSSQVHAETLSVDALARRIAAGVVEVLTTMKECTIQAANVRLVS